MSDKPERDNIVLIGFMGSGKSTVGRDLARRLRFQFLDTDRVIEDRTGVRIKQMFERHGEAYFRDRETAALQTLLMGTHRHVIATGGGIVTQPRNLPLLRKLGWVVLLKADPDEICRRVGHGKTRPLLDVEDPRAKVEQLLAERGPIYEEAAQFVVDSTGLRREEVVKRIAVEARRVFAWDA